MFGDSNVPVYEPLLRPSLVSGRRSATIHDYRSQPSVIRVLRQNYDNFDRNAKWSNGRKLPPINHSRSRSLHNINNLSLQYNPSHHTDPFIQSFRDYRNYAVTNLYNVKKQSTMVKRRYSETTAVYDVEVTMGAQENAGTAANLYLQLVSTSSHERVSKQRLPCKLRDFNGQRLRFVPGGTHKCTVRGSDIKKLDYAVLECDSISEFDACFVESVFIRNTLSKHQWSLQCNAWLSLYHDDGLTSRQLFVEQLTLDPALVDVELEDYKITIKTGDHFGAGTNANVYVTLFDVTGDVSSAKLHLNKANAVQKDKQPFKKGAEDTFVVQGRKLDDIQKLRLEHDNTGFGAGWFVDWVALKTQGHRYKFECNRWLADDEDDGRTCVDLTPYILGVKHQADERMAPKVNYAVETHTGDRFGAGTNANVFVTLFGEHGDSGELQLCGSGDLFERDQIDFFNFDLPTNLGALQSVRVRHDDSGIGAGCVWGGITRCLGSRYGRYPESP